MPKHRIVRNAEVSLRRAGPGDADAYLAVERSVIEKFRDTYSGVGNEKEALEELKNNTVYFIERSGGILGTVQYKKEKTGVYLSGLVVDSKFHRQGVGRAALSLILKELRSAKRIYLATHPKNSPAISLYLSLGFVIEAWKDDYYGDGEPRIIMARTA